MHNKELRDMENSSATVASKIITRFEKVLATSPSFIKSLVYSQESPKENKEPSDNLIATSESFQNLKALYQETISKYIKPCSPKSVSPNPTFLTARSENSSPIKPVAVVLVDSKEFKVKLSKLLHKSASRQKFKFEKSMNLESANLSIKEEDQAKLPKRHSEKIIQGKNTEKRWSKLYNQGREKKKELERIRSELEISEKKMVDCSFKPKILQHSQNSNPTKTVERLSTWAKARDEKIRQKKDNEQEKNLKSCTFTPKITQQPAGNEDLAKIKGVSKFIERGQKIKLEYSPAENLKSSPSKPLNKKKYQKLVEELHEELFSLDI